MRWRRIAIAAIPFGWALWRITDDTIIATIGFGASLALCLAFALRKTWWTWTGR